MPALATLTLSALAAKAGVDVDTLKSYDRLGLVSRPRRTVRGLQLYPADEVERIVFIKRSLELGFPAASIRDMLGIGRRGALTCSDIYDIAEKQIADIRRRRADLERMEAALEPLLEACPRRGGLDGCPIVGALSQTAPATAGG
ncbi:MAG: MerR family DNA-binding protein [Reyranella sp.]|nr:MerR family DNA-binding protein [Reyranella sp.]